MKDKIETEWAFRDFEGMLTFLKNRSEGKAVSQLVKLDDLVPGPPRRWMGQYLEQQKQQFSLVAEARFVSSLQNGDECREALTAWREMPRDVRDYWLAEMKSAENVALRKWLSQAIDPMANSLVQETIRRWRELDEQGFLGSQFVKWEQGE
ncbi:hypothetical protein V2O64_22030 [Verrucomicrobiaceae bacterium 227]